MQSKLKSAIGLAINVRPISGRSEWYPLAEYGVCDYQLWDNGQSTTCQQIFQIEQAQSMVAALSDQQARQGANFRGLSIFVGHPDLAPSRWPDDRRLGSVTALAAREDGLYASLAWNDLGQKNYEQGYYLFPEPVWQFDESAAKLTQIIRPERLQSVGLTNLQKLSTSRPWTNSANPALPASFFEGSPVGFLPNAMTEWDVDLTTPEGRQKAFDAELERLRGEGIEDLNEAIAQMRIDSRSKAIIAAMEKADAARQ